MRDLSIMCINSMVGVINFVSPARGQLTLTTRGNPSPVLVLVAADTRIRSNTGATLRLSQLVRGQSVAVTGTYNQAVGLMTHAGLIVVGPVVQPAE